MNRKSEAGANASLIKEVGFRLGHVCTRENKPHHKVLVKVSSQIICLSAVICKLMQFGVCTLRVVSNAMQKLAAFTIFGALFSYGVFRNDISGEQTIISYNFYAVPVLHKALFDFYSF